MTFWLLSSTFYGQWLPGDPRGSVTNVRDRRDDDANPGMRTPFPAMSLRKPCRVSSGQRSRN